MEAPVRRADIKAIEPFVLYVRIGNARKGWTENTSHEPGAGFSIDLRINFRIAQAATLALRTHMHNSTDERGTSDPQKHSLST
jgi:hypothetical protein